MSEAKIKGSTWLETVGPFGWFVRYEYTDTWLDFEAFECIGEEMHPQAGRKLFCRKDDRPDHTDDLSAAAVTIGGFVKWDGCSEMTLEQPHFCGAAAVEQYGAAMRQLHRLCLLLPSVDLNCAGYPPGKVEP